MRNIRNKREKNAKMTRKRIYVNSEKIEEKF